MKKEKSIDWLLTTYMPFFETLKMDRPNLEFVYNQWKELHPNSRANDFIWYIFNELLLIIAKQAKTELELYKYQRDVYFEMVFFLKKIESRNANHILKPYTYCVLKVAKFSPLFLKAEVIADPRCEVCKTLKYLAPIDQALTDRIIPLENCPNPLGCTCSYAFVSERDENGKLILNNKFT